MEQILKYSKTYLATVLKTTTVDLNNELSTETKKAVSWIDGKKQVFKPRFAKLIIEDYGLHSDITELIKRNSK